MGWLGLRGRVDEFGRLVGSGNDTSTLSDTEKIHDRIRKILALTQSPDEREASAAATKLQELLTAHNLSMADLEARGQAAPGMREQGHDLGKAAFKWKLDLAEGIAEFYYCASLVNRKTKSVAFVGRPENVESLTMLYSWVIDQIKAIATTERRTHFDTTGEHIDPLRWQVAFGEGAVERLIVRLKEMKARQLEDMSRDDMGNVTALAVHHQSEVSDYLEEKFGYRTDGKMTKREAESEARWAERSAVYAAEAAKQDELRIQCEAAGDMEPYYAAYPLERPEVKEANRIAHENWHKKIQAQERRNARRRTGSYRAGASVDERKEGQSDTARSKGREASSKVNLQPFIAGAVDRKKVG